MLPTESRPVNVLSSAITVLSGLKIWDLEFDDKTPYMIVSKVIAGTDVSVEDTDWLNQMINRLENAISILEVNRGCLCGTLQVLLAVQELVTVGDDISEMSVYNIVAKAQSLARPAGVK